MKCKVFEIENYNDKEDSINEWLKDEGPITIEYVTTLKINDGMNYGYLYIFYSTRKDKLERLDEIRE